MSMDRDQLYALLPALHRIRDAQAGMPLAGLLSVIASQVAVLEEDLNQLYDDQFIETCSPWVVPYLGELVGSLGTVPPNSTVTARADVARTIAYRRRKGTAAILEQLARDVTGWPALVVEFFQHTCRCAHVNHLREHSQNSLSIRDQYRLTDINGPFEAANHTVDLRSVSKGQGKYSTCNLGVYLWRLRALSLSTAPFKFSPAPDDGRYLFSPLGTNTQLFVRADQENEITSLAQKHHVPAPLTRLEAYTNLALYYGHDKSLTIEVDGPSGNRELVPIDNVCICNLASGEDGSWYHVPAADQVAIDPELGRLCVGADRLDRSLRVVYHYGQPAALGGGEYDRVSSFDRELFSSPGLPEVIQVPNQAPTLALALQTLGDRSGVIEFTDSQRHFGESMPPLAVNQRLELRAANNCRPVIQLNEPLMIAGGQGATILLNGLLITGASLVVPQLIPGQTDDNRLSQLSIKHCTLVPGLALDIDGKPAHPELSSLVAESSLTQILLAHSISGPMRLAKLTRCQIIGSIVDAMSPNALAIANLNGTTHGGELTIQQSTILGQVMAEQIGLLKNTIFREPVHVNRKQSGCCSFCYLPAGSRTPKRFRCQPETAVAAALEARKKSTVALTSQLQNQLVMQIRSSVRPSFVSQHYGHAAYVQLAELTPDEVKAGADDEAEMGVYHDLFQPQRMSLLRVKLQEYLRLGLEIGIVPET